MLTNQQQLLFIAYYYDTEFDCRIGISTNSEEEAKESLLKAFPATPINLIDIVKADSDHGVKLW